jgi:hypothetical protein
MVNLFMTASRHKTRRLRRTCRDLFLNLSMFAASPLKCHRVCLVLNTGARLWLCVLATVIVR